MNTREWRDTICLHESTSNSHRFIFIQISERERLRETTYVLGFKSGRETGSCCNAQEDVWLLRLVLTLHNLFQNHVHRLLHIMIFLGSELCFVLGPWLHWFLAALKIVTYFSFLLTSWDNHGRSRQPADSQNRHQEEPGKTKEQKYVLS